MKLLAFTSAACLAMHSVAGLVPTRPDASPTAAIEPRSVMPLLEAVDKALTNPDSLPTTQAPPQAAVVYVTTTVTDRPTSEAKPEKAHKRKKHRITSTTTRPTSITSISDKATSAKTTSTGVKMVTVPSAYIDSVDSLLESLQKAIGTEKPIPTTTTTSTLRKKLQTRDVQMALDKQPEYVRGSAASPSTVPATNMISKTTRDAFDFGNVTLRTETVFKTVVTIQGTRSPKTSLIPTSSTSTATTSSQSSTATATSTSASNSNSNSTLPHFIDTVGPPIITHDDMRDCIQLYKEADRPMDDPNTHHTLPDYDYLFVQSSATLRLRCIRAMYEWGVTFRAPLIKEVSPMLPGEDGNARVVWLNGPAPPYETPGRCPYWDFYWAGMNPGGCTFRRGPLQSVKKGPNGEVELTFGRVLVDTSAKKRLQYWGDHGGNTQKSINPTFEDGEWPEEDLMDKSKPRWGVRIRTKQSKKQKKEAAEEARLRWEWLRYLVHVNGPDETPGDLVHVPQCKGFGRFCEYEFRAGVQKECTMTKDMVSFEDEQHFKPNECKGLQSSSHNK